MDNQAPANEARFNVVARLPDGRTAESVRPLALAVGISPERVDALVKALGSSRAVRVGASVSKERADKAKLDFTAAGLEVFVEPVLTLAPVETVVSDGRERCPACGDNVIPLAQRQCPSCGVYMDKVSAEAKLRRKILEQERARIAAQLSRDDKAQAERDQKAAEDALRMKIRAELEAEHGLQVKPSLFSGRTGAWRALGLLMLTGGAFGAGWGLKQLTQPQTEVAGPAPAAAGGISMQAVDRIMGSLAEQGGTLSTAGLGAGAGGARPEAEEAAASGVGGTGNAAGLVPGALSGDESLTRIAEERRRRAEGGDVESSAHQDLAKSGSPAAQAADGAASSAQGLLSPLVKTGLVADFAVRLAELGQVPRAREALERLKATPGVKQDPAQAATARLAEFQVQAWAVRVANRPVDAAETLRSDLQRLPDAAQRAVALGRVGAILAGQQGLPEGMPLSFLLKGGEALRAVAPGGVRNAAAGDWLLSMGQALTEDIREHARVGRWNKVQGLAEQLDALAAQTQGSTPLAGLRGLQAQVRRLLGQAEAEEKLVAEATREIAELATPLARAEALRSFGVHSGEPAQARVQAAVRGQVASLEGQKGPEAAYSLARLALLQADAGLFDAYAALKAKALVVPGPNRRESVTLNAELMVGSELAQVRQLHRAGQFGAAEQHLRQLAYELL